MLINLGLSANIIHDDSRINHARVDAYGQPNHQLGITIQRRQPAYEDILNEKERIMDYHKANQRRSACAAQP